MTLSAEQLQYVRDNRAAAMITIGRDGRPKAVRIGTAVVDGKIWSSGTADRVRTHRLRKDPRCTLFVFGGRYEFLTLETTVTILEGPDAPQQSVRLVREMSGRPTGPLGWFGRELDEDEFLQAMVDEQRVVYEFKVERAYGAI
jgi:PPOX class probable F420-dependent enzyme